MEYENSQVTIVDQIQIALHFRNSLNNLLNGGEEGDVESRKPRLGGAFAQPQARHGQAAAPWQISTPHANWERNSLHSAICGLLRRCMNNRSMDDITL
jgi:hypothetical protein